jgi:peptide deformylase
MASKDIVLYPDAPLTKKAAAFKNVGPEVAKLAAEMFEIMDVYDGCGLAGPQVGVSKRIAVLRDPEKQTDICLINPEISEAEGQEFLEEGCLSLPQVFAMVPRYTRLRVRGLNQHGKPVDFEATGMLARIVQHEVDHLNGVVFLDRVDLLTREAKFREWQEIRSEMLAAAEDQ